MDTRRRSPRTTTVVLVEGVSDRVALTTLALRRGRDLEAAGVAVVPMGGATNVGRYLREYGPGGAALRLAGLCDLAEARHFRRALERTGVATDLADDDGPTALERHGFFVCARDLEEELIRSLGAEGVVQVIEAQGELPMFRTFQNQPAQREKPLEAQLRRFLGTHSGRKAQYARALVEALPDGVAPLPLDGLLAHV
ncbi:MAG: TOPRIM nucleotidyl transferase/hydrolase domain-containing protein [Nocardioides sp.]